MIRLTHDLIDYTALTEQVRRSGCGAVVLFLGTVRDLTGEQVTVALDEELRECASYLVAVHPQPTAFCYPCTCQFSSAKCIPPIRFNRARWRLPERQARDVRTVCTFTASLSNLGGFRSMHCGESSDS